MALSSGVECPSCQSPTPLKRLGHIHVNKPFTFCGMPTQIRLDEVILWKCESCELLFKYPYLSQHELNRLYQSIPTGVWEASSPKAFWTRVRDDIEGFGDCRQKTILEIGAYEGYFLKWLDLPLKKIGTELLEPACRLAREDGLDMLNCGIEDLELQGIGLSDFVCMFDVIEHFVNPKDALIRAGNCLKRGGRLYLYTGNPASWHWKWTTPYYWYSSLPEHLSFISKKWLQQVSGETRLRLLSTTHFSSDAFGIKTYLSQGVKSFLYAVHQKRQRKGKFGLTRFYPFSKVQKWQAAPWWTTARDHSLYILGRI